MRKAAFHNLGCKVNSYETEAMQQLLEEAGYEIVPFKEGADVYIINTCSVTNIADRKSRQMLHKAKKMNPDSAVVAVGCYVQAAGEELKKDPAVDLIVGNNRKAELVSILEDYFNSRMGEDPVIDIGKTHEYENLSISRIADHTRAFIKVQDGCNQFCSYCIIPYTRGRVRSRSLEDVVEEAGRLADAGYSEVVLTGIHLSSYGIDFPEEKKEDLLGLIKRIHQIEKIKRIRLGSLEPRIVTEAFAGELSKLSKICPHFHLSLQSGCDETLKRMNRRYDTGEYEACCENLRRFFDNPAITTDVIVGFPGETEEEFEQTRACLERIHFYEMHVFKYSKRQGTRAAAMENQVPEPVKASRSDVLLKLDESMSKEYRLSCLGSVKEVLLEEKITINGRDYMIGHTKEYVKAVVPYEGPGQKNQLISGRLDHMLTDEIVYLV
ncbi:tRNA (N(6)-L-threonylcarbamoyladenosine(37)-C(2))-methylthiotransferase MtaB [Clostridium sp. MCC353]|uniref:tRNA (N(6)-L-threonylcarbamoyladenosine(37)-C(2))- methylthiotransferase MtaB n=1 Tax=Clostridium sp. MCC353 TaxID=2592646 RepID=UPI001C00CDB9|nr:tRNA (N(6)-L-threonylcarbamoyladenosine(37)-C(2))-methylthiotransferase MtaB [Clostridium sp. MCC353]MBT9775565.1 tRNA (N(6)-L-threonylcarbamoyladenosine(37)-C(2))-methylthiotransferase MtaB [Clostridium sp. MCC353]